MFSSSGPLRAADPWSVAFLRTPLPSPGHVVLRARDGAVAPLARRGFARPGDRFVEVDARPRLLSLAPQAIATVEGVDVHVTATVAFTVTDAVRFVLASANAEEEIYLATQIALRDVVARTPLEDVLARGVELGAVRDATRAAGSRVGVAVDDVVLKDVRAPKGLAAAREEALVVDLEARTALERARGELKATRARLASAQMLDRSPALARLRMIEAMAPGTSVTFTEGAPAPRPAQDDAAAREIEG